MAVSTHHGDGPGAAGLFSTLVPPTSRAAPPESRAPEISIPLPLARGALQISAGGFDLERFRGLVRTLSAHLALDYAELRLLGGDAPSQPVARVGRPVESPERFAIAQAGRVHGELRVGRKAHGLFPHERRMLTEYAGLLAPALDTALRTEDPASCRRLRQDLHDRVGPVLTAALLRAETFMHHLRHLPDAPPAGLTELREDIRAGLEEVRRLARDAPPRPGQRSLVDELHRQIRRFELVTGIQFLVNVDERSDHAPAEVRRAAQLAIAETLTNVAKHSNASWCEVTVSCDAAMEVTVTDDGRGLPPDCPEGVGLASIRERARALGGSCVIERARPQGTTVRITLPVTAEPATVGHRQEAAG